MASTAERQQQIAARNVELILDAAEELLSEGAAASIAAVAARSGVSRVTVYAHFATKEDLLEAVVRRSVEHSTTVLREAAQGARSPREQLERVVTAAWGVLQRHHAISRAAARELPSAGRTRAHEDVHAYVAGLIRDGQADGTIRDDLEPEWLAGVIVAIVHAAAEQVQDGAMTRDGAGAALATTVSGLLDSGSR